MKLRWCVFLCIWVTCSANAMDYVIYKEKEYATIETMNNLPSAVSILSHQLKLVLYTTERMTFYLEDETHSFAEELPPTTIGMPFCVYNFKTPTTEKVCSQHEDDVSKIAIMEHVVQHIFDLLYVFDTEKLETVVLQSLKTITIILGQFSGKVSCGQTILNTPRLREKLLHNQEVLLSLVEPFKPPFENRHGEKQYCAAIYTALAKKHLKRDDVTDQDLRLTLNLYDTVRLQS